MATLNNLAALKLTAAKKPRALPEGIKRRNKLLQKLKEQRELAAAFASGLTYMPRRLRSVRDLTTGERTVREMPVRIKAWWWTGEKVKRYSVSSTVPKHWSWLRDELPSR